MQPKKDPHAQLLQAQKSLKRSPDDVHLWRRLAQALWRAGRREEAYLTIHQAFRRFPGHGELHLQVGLFHAAEGHLEQARGHLELAAQADCANAQAHYWLGMSAAAAGDVQSAFRSLQRAMLLRPDDLVLAQQVSLAARAASQQGLPANIRLPRQAHAGALACQLASDADLAEAFMALPQDRQDGQLLGMLEVVLGSAVKAHPGRADLHYRYSQVLGRLGRTEAAIRHARRALRLDARLLQAGVHLARLYEGAGKPLHALAALRRAIAAGADWPDVHVLAGELMNRCGRSRQAAEHFRRALELNPAYARAADELGRLAA